MRINRQKIADGFIELASLDEKQKKNKKPRKEKRQSFFGGNFFPFKREEKEDGEGDYS